LDGEFNALLGVLGQGLQALYTDLGDRMRKVTVVVMSEFGRTIEENASQGTDHGHGNMMMLMSGGVQGGQVFADWSGLGPDGRDDADDLAITTDYRNVMAEIIQRRLLNSNINAVFPKFTPTPLGLFKTIND